MSHLAIRIGPRSPSCFGSTVGRPQSSNGSVDLEIDRLGRTTNKSLRTNRVRDCDAGSEKVESGGGVKALPGCSNENPRELKTQEGIGLLAELISLPVVTDCCPAQGLGDAVARAGVTRFGE
jgi:hypothetical protein